MSDGIHYGANVTEANVNHIMQLLSAHYGVSVVENGASEYDSISDIAVADVGQIWLGEGTAPAITALSLDDMPVNQYVPVTVNAVIGSVANVLCLVTKLNDNTVEVAVCKGGNDDGCFVWDGTQLRFLPDAQVDTSALSTAVASALTESEGRTITVSSVGTDESYTQARPTNYLGAAQPVPEDLNPTLVTNAQMQNVLVLNGNLGSKIVPVINGVAACDDGGSIEFNIQSLPPIGAEINVGNLITWVHPATSIPQGYKAVNALFYSQRLEGDEVFTIDVHVSNWNYGSDDGIVDSGYPQLITWLYV